MPNMVWYYTHRKRNRRGRNHGRWYEQTEKGGKKERIRTAVDDIEEAVKITVQITCKVTHASM